MVQDAKGAATPCVILGIDPGVHTGVAVFVDGELQGMFTVKPHEIARTITTKTPARVIFEDSRLQSHAWNAHSKANKSAGFATARSLGQVDALCSLITAICEELSIPCHGISPAAKGVKRDAENFEAITGWTKSSNQHTRDAAMVAWSYRRAAL